MVFHFSSPHLSEDDRSLRECPVGAVLRDAPYTYDSIRASNYVESGALNPLESPLYLQRALGVIAAERDRLWRMRDDDAKSKRDSESGIRLRRGNR